MAGNAPLRLALIVGVDVAGYSARTEADSTASAHEVLTLRDRLNAVAGRHGGRVFNTAGDGVMMEFVSAREAVAAIFELLDQRPHGEPDVRVGAHLGDVSVAANGDLLGHGVNVAARLIDLAEPGRALISAELKAAMGAEAARPMRSLGEVTLAKMRTKVTVFEIAPCGDATLAPPDVRTSGVSIAVLPFVNMSSDPEQEYFSDGITADIITDLSRWPSLAVLSSHATFRFKGQAVDARHLGREVGARFLVEGSVRRMAERIRITAQLIDAETGNHVWAERFDRPLIDLFAVQDEVVRTIVGTLVGRVYTNEAERLRRKPPSSLTAYDLTLRGNWLPWDDPILGREAKHAFERAIEVDPGYGLPHSFLAVVLLFDWLNDPFESDHILDRALALAQRGVDLTDNESASHSILGAVYLRRRSFDLALRHVERSVEINFVNPWRQADLGSLLTYLGRAEEGFERLRNARAVDPYFGPLWYWRDLGLAQFAMRRYAEALADYDRAASNSPTRSLAVMAGCCVKLGLSERAQELLAQCSAARPGLTIGRLLTRFPFQRDGDTEHLAECLRLAGMPD